MARIIILMLACIVWSSCGIVPGCGRLFSDSQKAGHYALSGATKTRVKMDWGKPDKILENDSSETWIYYNRQDGEAFKFAFNKKGMLVVTNID